jgi:cytochrome c oxidase cbb3-type subunit 3
MWWRNLLIIVLLAALVVTFIILRQDYPYQSSLTALAAQDKNIVISNLYAGGAPYPSRAGPDTNTPEAYSSYDVSEGKRLYQWYNCSTCHAHGGGDIGPPLMDDKWLYGSKPQNIYATIIEGRPNGMPSYGGKIPEKQIWQIVAYIRSMTAHVPFYTRPSRNDDMNAKPAENRAPVEPANHSSNPSADNRSSTP